MLPSFMNLVFIRQSSWPSDILIICIRLLYRRELPHLFMKTNQAKYLAEKETVMKKMKKSKYIASNPHTYKDNLTAPFSCLLNRANTLE